MQEKNRVFKFSDLTKRIMPENPKRETARNIVPNSFPLLNHRSSVFSAVTVFSDPLVAKYCARMPAASSAKL